MPYTARHRRAAVPCRAALVLLLVAVGALLTVGCGEAQPEGPSPEAGLHIEDDLGRTVRLDAPAGRLVTLAPNLTEIAFAAGAGDRLAAVTVPDDHPPAVEALPRVSVLPLDFERVAAARPDLALATDQINNPRDAATLDALGIPTVFFSFDRVEDVFAAVERVGRLAGTEAAARRAADSLRTAFRDLAERTAALDRKPRVLFLVGDETLYAFGRHSYTQEMIAAAGGRSVTAHIDRRAPVLSEEFVLEARPDVIVGAWGEDYDPGRLARLHPAWRDLPAVQEGRVHSVDPDLVLRPGPRVVEGTRRLAALLHPEALARPDTTAPAAP